MINRLSLIKLISYITFLLFLFLLICGSFLIYESAFIGISNFRNEMCECSLEPTIENHTTSTIRGKSKASVPFKSPEMIDHIVSFMRFSVVHYTNGQTYHSVNNLKQWHSQYGFLEFSRRGVLINTNHACYEIHKDNKIVVKTLTGKFIVTRTYKELLKRLLQEC